MANRVPLRWLIRDVKDQARAETLSQVDRSIYDGLMSRLHNPIFNQVWSEVWNPVDNLIAFQRSERARRRAER